MLNHEAISVIESIRAKTDYCLISDEARSEALDMAISALEAQEQEERNCSTCKHKEAGIAFWTKETEDAICRDCIDGVYQKWESQSNNSPQLDKENGEYLATNLQPTCNQTHETAQNVQNSQLNCQDMQNDLISRKAAIDAIKDADVVVFYDEDTTADDAIEVAIISTKRSMVGSIESLPSAQPEIGEWIENRAQNHVERCFFCSECGFDAWGVYEKTRFCSGCGAMMKNPYQEESV